MADQQAQQGEGVNRRQFLRFAGLGLVSGLAAMVIGNRLRGARRPADVRVAGDSMFRPREAAGPRG